LECKCGCGTSFIGEDVLWQLEDLRVLIGRPFSPFSAARCPVHNATVGGAPLSQHRSTEMRPCTAFDIPLVAPKARLIEAAEQVGFDGLGINYNTFLHVDNRGVHARW
jgi:hypothetical protein